MTTRDGLLTREYADFVVSYISALENYSNHGFVMDQLEKDGYTEQEIDNALKALGVIAGRDCGLL